MTPNPEEQRRKDQDELDRLLADVEDRFEAMTQALAVFQRRSGALAHSR